jgi:hypothetical protein
MIKKYKQLVFGLILGILVGGTISFMYNQYQNTAVNGNEDNLIEPQEVKNFNFSNYNVYIDGQTTKIIGEIKNDSQKKRTVKFKVDIVDDAGNPLGTTNEISMEIEAGTSKPFLSIVNKPIEDYTDVTFNVTSE